MKFAVSVANLLIENVKKHTLLFAGIHFAMNALINVERRIDDR